MGKHIKHRDSDLRDGLEHIVYEMWKYKQSIRYYGPIRAAGGDAALEFRVLHHRVLLEFFHGPAKHPDNILAWEYCANWDSAHQQPTWLESYRVRCHTMLAHISVQRTVLASKGLKDWGAEFLIAEAHIDQLIAEFLATLVESHKEICRQWIGKWYLKCPGSDVLSELMVSLD